MIFLIYNSITNFYIEMSVLLEELESYRPIPYCWCPVPCSREAVRNAKLYCDANNVMCFLNGLNVSFSMVRSQIFLINPLPSITTIFSVVLEHERQNSLVHGSEKLNDQSDNDYRVLIKGLIDLYPCNIGHFRFPSCKFVLFTSVNFFVLIYPSSRPNKNLFFFKKFSFLFGLLGVNQKKNLQGENQK